MQHGGNPFGDGHAAGRVVAALDAWFAGRQPLLAAEDEFHPELS